MGPDLGPAGIMGLRTHRRDLHFPRSHAGAMEAKRHEVRKTDARYSKAPRRYPRAEGLFEYADDKLSGFQLLNEPCVGYAENRRRDGPADGKYHHERRKIRFPGKDGIHPGHAGAADAEEGNQRRYERAAVAAHRSGQHFDDGVDKFQAGHVFQADKAQGDDRTVVAENMQQRHAEQDQQGANTGRQQQVLKQAPLHRLFAPSYVPGPVILADEGRADLSEGVDQEEGKDFQVEGRRRRRHDVGPQFIDSRLDAQVGQGEDHALHPCRQADAQHRKENPFIYMKLRQADADFRLAAAQEIKQHGRAQGRRDDRADCHAFNRHIQDEDKE